MHIADMTMFYAPASGGVRTYLEAKHRRLQQYAASATASSCRVSAIATKLASIRYRRPRSLSATAIDFQYGALRVLFNCDPFVPT